MQDVDAAVAELDRIVATHGFRGVSINPNVEGRDYDDPVFERFWERVTAHDILVVLHPNGFTHGQRLSDYYLINVVGNPLESTVAVSRMIFGGVFERHPDAKVCVVHGGGYLPFYPDRMDHAYQVRPECREHISAPPSSYLQQLYFDTVVFGDSLDMLVDRVGAYRLVLGTDYPYDMGQTNPLGHLEAANISEREATAIASETARRLLNL
jgi:aminocarboxymuconate-semialdehyde decarboxylase